MCGLVGYYSNSAHGFDTSEKNFVREMLYVNALRGVDGTGLFYKTNQGDLQIHKAGIESCEFLRSKEFEEAENELFIRGRFFVGHCRAATRGVKNDANSHPFIVDDKIILSHNGTFFGDHKKHAETEVDSEAIAHVLAEEEDIAAALRKIDSAYALVWYNVETEKLHLIRNHYRPLYFGETKTGDYMFASESAMMYLTLWRNSMEFKANDNLMLKPYELVTIDKHHKMTRVEINARYEAPKTVVYSVPAVNVPQSIDDNTINWQYPSNVVDKRKSIMDIAEDLDIGSLNPKGLDWQTDILSSHEEVIIEVIDYEEVEPGSTNKIKDYYVIGEIISKHPKVTGTLYAYWMIHAENESAVRRYIYGDDMEAEPYFTGKFSFASGYKPREKFRWMARIVDVNPLTTFPVEKMQ